MRELLQRANILPLPTRTATLTDKLASASNSALIPALLLMFALSTVFLFANDRSQFYRGGHHGHVSQTGMTVAANFSPAHKFLMFKFLRPDEKGAPTYYAYNRFPMGSFALTKLAILPFGDDPAKQIYVARTLMLLFFVSAASLAYFALCRLTPSRWVALTATLLAFSSYYCLYYNDLVFNDVPSLFGVMLTFHGMVIFMQKGALRQLLVKACVALLLGWQVYALLLPFVILGFVGELGNARLFVSDPALSRIKLLWTSLLRSRYLIIGVVTLAFGALLLAFNLVNEYFALDGKRSLTELPTVGSMLWRMGLDDSYSYSYAQYADTLAWLTYLKEQFYRIGGMTLPFSLPGYIGALGKSSVGPLESHGVAIGIFAFSICLIGIAIVRRHRMLLAALSLSAFFWMLPMRHFVAFHDFQSMFYIGIPLVFFLLVMKYIFRYSGDRLVGSFAVASLLVFTLSAYQMSLVGHSAESSEAMMADFEVIDNIMDRMSGDAILISDRYRYEDSHVADYYLSGNVLDYKGHPLTNLIVTRNHDGEFGLLTPNNQLVFLYDKTLYDKNYDNLGSPAIESDFNVYLIERRLVYVDEEDCENDRHHAKFFLHVIPANENDLPSHRKQYSFDNLDFDLEEYRVDIIGRCVVGRVLPGYAIDEIRTGQYLPGTGRRIWEGSFRLDE